MSAACPKCQSKLPLDASQFSDDGTISCPSCQATLKVDLSVKVLDESEKVPGAGPGVALSDAVPTDGRRKVLLCIDGEGTREIIREILSEPQFAVLEVSNGKEALSSIREHQPEITMIDMGLTDIVGTELCSEIKSDPELGNTAVILVASMYDRSTKRHQPDSLLGADDYIDRSLIQKGLLDKVEKLLAREDKIKDEEKIPEPEMEGPLASVAVEEEAPPLESDRDFVVESPEPVSEKEPEIIQTPPEAPREELPEESAEQKDAKRLARIIVSDIALYNPKKVDEGIQNDTFFELLEEEIEEGKQHYLSRVSGELSQPMTYLDEAFADYINKRKSSMS
ncbi:MAG: response regulator [Nitrospiria bacterium]